MMNEQLERLIDLALADKEFSDKEKRVLQRKADELGIDKDEFEMVLDAKLFLAQKVNTESINFNKSSEGAINKLKEHKEFTKCPSCGAPIKSFSTNCGYCEYEFRNIETSKSIKRLILQLNEVEQKIRNSKSREGMLEGFMQIIDGETYFEKKIFNAKSNIISSFPIPNTKEDIIEFLALSIAQVNSIKIGALIKLFGTSGTYGYKITLKNAWLSLANRVIMKARFSMKEDKKTLEQIEYYAKHLNIK